MTLTKQHVEHLKGLFADFSIKQGTEVFMSAESGVVGYGNVQCVKSVCEPLGEISLYGQNICPKIHHISKTLPNLILIGDVLRLMRERSLLENKNLESEL